MQHKQLLHLLNQLGWTKEAASVFGPPKESHGTIYVESGDESLIIDRVARLDVGDDTAVVTTSKRERFGVTIDAISALRVVAEK